MTIRKIVKIDEEKCNGCGVCIPSCAEGALQIIDGKARLVSEKYCDGLGACLGYCPQDAIIIEEREADDFDEELVEAKNTSRLSNWPVQIMLVPPTAPYLQNADLLIAADCVPFAYADFHRDFLKDHVVLIGCPKLDDGNYYVKKLTEIFSGSDIKSISLAHMEVPCCFGLKQIVGQALANSKKTIPFKEYVIGVEGELLND